ncbi:CoA transferase, partial [Rhizobiaceae sp. 2RAB30]
MVDLLGAAGIPVSMIWDVAQAADSPHAEHRKLMTAVEHPSLGSLRLPEQPVHFDGQERGALRPAPLLGEDGPA